MKKLLMGTAGLVCAAMTAPSAYAATTTYTLSPSDFKGTATSDGTLTASIGVAGLGFGAFTDIFNFTLPELGIGSTSLSTSTSVINSKTDLDITSVTLNGFAADKTFSKDGKSEFFSLSDIALAAGGLNSLIVTGTSRGNGTFAGTLTFEPSITAVPEAATWSMLIMGFGLAGVSMRYRRKSIAVSYA